MFNHWCRTGTQPKAFIMYSKLNKLNKLNLTNYHAGHLRKKIVPELLKALVIWFTSSTSYFNSVLTKAQIKRKGLIIDRVGSK